jgi:hypothetical protein
MVFSFNAGAYSLPAYAMHMPCQRKKSFIYMDLCLIGQRLGAESGKLSLIAGAGIAFLPLWHAQSVVGDAKLGDDRKSWSNRS